MKLETSVHRITEVNSERINMVFCERDFSLHYFHFMESANALNG
jgi:hypothetical protein